MLEISSVGTKQRSTAKEIVELEEREKEVE